MKTYLYQINVTRDCNLRCTHCYIHSDVKKISGKMKEEDLIKITNDIVDHMRKIKYDKAEIHIVGGEPTILGLKFFENTIPKVKEILIKNNINHELSLITNILHEDIIKIALLFDRVNTSWETVTRFNKPKIETRWKNNLKQIQENNIKHGLTTSITKQAIDLGAENILNKLYYELNIKKLHFGFFIPSGDGLDNIETTFPKFHETSKFLIDVTKWYLEHREKDKELSINPIESTIRAIETEEPMDDIVCPIISGSIDIDYNGNAITCIEAGGNLDANFSGNVLETSIKDVTTTSKFIKDVINSTKQNKKCYGCEFYQICRSGCSVLTKYWDENNSEDCPGFKNFISFIDNEVKYNNIKSRQDNINDISINC